VPEAETRITRDFHLGDWVVLRDAVLQVIALVGGKREPGLALINQRLHSGRLDLALLAPDGSTLTLFSEADCKRRTIHAPFNPAEGVRVEPYEPGQHFVRRSHLAELTSPTTPATAAEVPKLSGKEWVPRAFAHRPDELLAMGITGASGALAEESKIAPDCAKPLTARYIEKLLRDLGRFPKAPRGSAKQRPK
jgi:hypothetical protein